MEILAHRALRGPNFYAGFPVIYMLLDIGDLEESPSDEIPGLPERIKTTIPTLVEHRCSPGVHGGFFQRLDRGTWAGHIVEHIAIELQCLAGMEVGFGKTRSTERYGIYTVSYRYRDEECGLLAGVRAVEILEDLIAQRPVDIEHIVGELKALRERHLFGPSTGAIVEEAKRRGIPVQRLNTQSHVMLGQGHKQRHIQASMTGQTTAMGVAIAADKSWTKRMLEEAGIPVPSGRAVTSADEAIHHADHLGYPVVVKPLDANHGRGITTNVTSAQEVQVAFDAARAHHDTVIVERFLVGGDHRLLVIGGTLVAAARRDPAHVTGDGTSSVRTLIERTNADPRRGVGHENVLTRIDIDHNTQRMLHLQHLTIDDVPAAGYHVALKSTANLSTGGTATDVTDEVHPSIRFMCERVARIVGLDIMGIDIVAPDLRTPLEDSGGGIVEVNAGPGLRMHLDPTHGSPRDVAGPIVDLMFPDNDNGRIPTVAITGTNGKTTTSRLVAHCIKYAGGRVGLAATGIVEVENQTILKGDYSGPMGAQTVLREPTVTHAVLEVARGGILRRGMGVDRVDVGVLLNVGRDHMGEGDIHDLEDLVRLKGTVPEAARTAVINADDEVVLAHHASGKLSRAVTLFSLDPEHPALAAHLEADPTNVVVTLADGAIELRTGRSRVRVADVVDIPITMGGHARFNIHNAMAAVAACHAIGLQAEDLRTGLMTFNPTIGQNPGRMNVFDVGPIRILVDFAHNVPALKGLDEVIPHLKPRPHGRVLRVAYLAGNRLEKDLLEVGAALATHCDALWVSDPDPRGRAPGETPKLLVRGAVSAGLDPEHAHTATSEHENFEACFAQARAGDLLIIQCEDPEGIVARIRRLQAEAQDDTLEVPT